MATKKKKSAGRKPAARPRSRSARKAPQALNAPALPAAERPSTASNNGVAIVMVLLALAIIGWLLLRSTRKAPAPVAPAATAAPTAVPAAPAARVIASPAATKAPRPKPQAQASAHRESAGAAEQGMPTLNYERTGKPLSLRCWRPEGGQAQLDVFAPRNRMVAVLKSASGPAGWVPLSWNGKDETGQAVAGGLYYVRPSQKSEQSVSEVWVK